MEKNILFVCATGIATSTAVAEKVIDYCRDHGVKFQYSQTNVSSVPSNSEGADLIISTTNIPYELSIPVINGLPLITGIGEDDVLEEIVSVLKEGE